MTKNEAPCLILRVPSGIVRLALRQSGVSALQNAADWVLHDPYMMTLADWLRLVHTCCPDGDEHVCDFMQRIAALNDATAAEPPTPCPGHDVPFSEPLPVVYPGPEAFRVVHRFVRGATVKRLRCDDYGVECLLDGTWHKAPFALSVSAFYSSGESLEVWLRCPPSADGVEYGRAGTVLWLEGVLGRAAPIVPAAEPPSEEVQS